MSKTERTSLRESLHREVRTFIANALLFNARVAEQVGMNVTDMQCLHLLYLEGPATPGRLARRCGLTSGGITVVLDRLESAGYIRREANPEDRRSFIIRPISARIRKFEAMYRSKSRALAGVLSGFDEPGLGLILDFFRKANLAGSTPEPS
jgi:DNA-binding MarR family transcriptional regulator